MAGCVFSATASLRSPWVRLTCALISPNTKWVHLRGLCKQHFDTRFLTFLTHLSCTLLAFVLWEVPGCWLFLRLSSTSAFILQVTPGCWLLRIPLIYFGCFCSSGSAWIPTVSYTSRLLCVLAWSSSKKIKDVSDGIILLACLQGVAYHTLVNMLGLLGTLAGTCIISRKLRTSQTESCFLLVYRVGHFI